MNEHSALEVTAARALEEGDAARAMWTDEDRAWASRAAAQVVGDGAAPAAFIARRASLVLERLATRDNVLPRGARALRWRPGVGGAIIVLAFVAGVAADRVGDAQVINVLAPPVLLLVLWNLVVYAMLAAGFVLRYGEAGPLGPLRRALIRLAAVRGGSTVGHDNDADPVPRALATMTREWIALSAPLYGKRAARILHLAAAAIAVGVVIGLYTRGLVFEYRATWESTFLDAPTVRAMLAIVYAPGAWLTGIAVPDVAQIAAIRAPGSANAAPWLHLIAATLVLLVIVPRLALALGARLVERHRAASLPVALTEPYFLRLLRGLHDGPVPVRVVPYSFTPDPSAATTLAAILARAVGGNAAVNLAAVVAYGAEDLPTDIGATPPWSVALFNLAATPEPETHGAFVAAMAAKASAAAPLLILVDEAAFRARLGEDASRLETRRDLWRRLCEDHRCRPVFVDLAAPDLTAAEAAIDAVLAGSPRSL